MLRYMNYSYSVLLIIIHNSYGRDAHYDYVFMISKLLRPFDRLAGSDGPPTQLNLVKSLLVYRYFGNRASCLRAVGLVPTVGLGSLCHGQSK